MVRLDTRVSAACVSRWLHDVKLHPVEKGVVVDRAGVCSAPTEALYVWLSGLSEVLTGHR